MKILHLVHNFPPEFFGGTELYVLRLSQELIERGHSIWVVTGSEMKTARAERREENHKGVPVIRLFRRKADPADLIDIYDAEIERFFLEILRETDPDLVHLHHWFNLTNNLLCLSSQEGRPGVITLHDLWATCVRFFRQDFSHSFCTRPSGIETCFQCIQAEYPFPEKEARESLERRLAVMNRELSAASCLIFPSEAQRRFVARVMDIHGKVQEVLPHGRLFPISPKGEARERPFPQGPLGVGHWGHLVEAKGIHLLVEAARIIGFREDLEWHIWGEAIDKNYGSRLRKRAEGYPVSFHGTFQPGDIPGFKRFLDLVVIPSLCHESYSFVMEEAFTLGLPVLASDRGALPERLGRGGRTFRAGDAGDLASQIQGILERPRTLEEIRAFPGKPFSVEENAERMEALYEGVLRSSGPNRERLEKERGPI